MRKKPMKAHANKWAGVYYYELENTHNGKPDRCFYFTYRLGRKMVWKKVGKLSEGFGPEVAYELRAKTILGVSSGDKVLTPKEERLETDKRDRTFAEIASLYFSAKEGVLKGFYTDKNRYEKHLEKPFGRKRISDIEPEDVEKLKKGMRKSKPATVWNVLELFRRIVNYGIKTNRCAALSFQIEMPIKDNEVIEYLKPDEAQRFLEVIESWPERDVSHMLRIAYFTGMRRGEIFKLEDRDLDFHMHLIHIRSPKGGKTSTIGMSGMVEGILQAQLEWKREHHPDSPFVFPGKGGGMRVDCSAVNNIRKAAGLPITFRPFHGLRHHFAVTLANSGKFTLNMISEALTHKNVDFTKKKYAQFLPETLAAIGNAAADVLQFKE